MFFSSHTCARSGKKNFERPLTPLRPRPRRAFLRLSNRRSDPVALIFLFSDDYSPVDLISVSSFRRLGCIFAGFPQKFLSLLYILRGSHDIYSMNYTRCISRIELRSTKSDGYIETNMCQGIARESRISIGYTGDSYL